MVEQQVHQGPPPGSETAGALIAQGDTIRQVQAGGYATAVAVQRARDLKDVTARCIEEATLGGEDMYYNWAVKSKRKDGSTRIDVIEGPSIQMALAAVRNFGNAAVIQRPVIETPKSFIFTAAFIDLETGFTLERQYRMDRSFVVHGKMDSHRKEDIRFQIGQSKAVRNVVANAIPAGIITKMMHAAKSSVRTTIEKRIEKAKGDIGAVIDATLQSFARHGVTEGMITQAYGLAREHWDVETLVRLAGDWKTLQRGDETAESLYGSSEPDKSSDHDSKGNEGVKEKLRQKQAADPTDEPTASAAPAPEAPEPQTAEAPPPNPVAGIPGERIAQKAKDLKALSREDLEGLAGELTAKLRKLGVIKSDAQEHGLMSGMVQAGIIRDVNFGAEENSTYEVRRAVALLYLIHESKAPANAKKKAEEPAGF